MTMVRRGNEEKWAVLGEKSDSLRRENFEEKTRDMSGNKDERK